MDQEGNAQTVDDLVGLTFPAVIGLLGSRRAQQPAVTLDDGSVMTFGELDRWSTHMAHHLAELGAREGSFVTIASPNSFEYVLACAAAWKVGAIPQPVSSRLPEAELHAIVELADSAVVVGHEYAGRPFVAHGQTIAANDTPLPDVASPSWKAPTSGGSTGRPKLIVAGDPAIYSEALAGRAERIGAAAGQTMVMPGPLYHNGPFIWMWGA
ncbi:MAG: AMP-binding protein, partial [Acidimicrobiales bacterium]|nr:AMP-binding protein [Acidimicrobiales bacterium]